MEGLNKPCRIGRNETLRVFEMGKDGKSVR